MRSFYLLVFVFGAFFTSSASFALDSLEIREAKLQLPLVKSRPGKGSLMIHNKGDNPDNLIGVSIEKVGRAEMHQSINVDGMSSMIKLETIPVSANKMLNFEETGLHFMIFDLDPEVKEGDELQGTLTFEHGGDTITIFKVVKLGSKAQMNH